MTINILRFSLIQKQVFESILCLFKNIKYLKNKKLIIISSMFVSKFYDLLL